MPAGKTKYRKEPINTKLSPKQTKGGNDYLNKNLYAPFKKEPNVFGPSVDSAKLQKPFKMVLTAVNRKPFEISEDQVKADFDSWWKVGKRDEKDMSNYLWKRYEVSMIKLASFPLEQEKVYHIFRQSIVRHVSIFFGDYLRAGGTSKRQFPIPECSEIGLGRSSDEISSEVLDSLAGSQGEVKFKSIPYYDAEHKGSFLTNPDGAVKMITKYFVIRDKKTKDGESDAEKQKKRAKKNKEKSRQNYLRELSALKALSHPNIVHGICTVESRLQIVYPLLHGGDLVPLSEDPIGLKVSRAGGRTTAILNPDQTFLPRFAGHLIEAVAHMHAQGYIHLDLKPENFVVAGPDRSFTRSSDSPDLDAYHLVLIDFGLSEVEAQLGDGCIKSGTEVTMAPEQIMCNAPVGFGTDWWGVAASLYRLRIFWEPSIDEKSRDDLMKARDPQWGHTSLPMQPFFSPDFKDLLNLMLKPDPEDREFDSQLEKLTGHPYLQKYRDLRK